MKCFLALSFMLSMFQVDINVDQSVNGGYCVMSMNDQSVLASKNPHYAQSVASISKIMTTIVAIEEGDLNEMVVVSDVINNVDGSMLYLEVGDKFTLKELLIGLMLRSGNDAALMIATHISGNEKDFAKLMNKKAKQLGMKNSNFTNASGLDEITPNTSSSCDMALLMSYAMKNPTFREIDSKLTYSPHKGILWINKNKFLKQYPYATGGKTGFTLKARRTLVTTSKKEDLEVVVVTLNADDDFMVHETLHDEAYEKFESVKIANKGTYNYRKNKIYIGGIYQTIKKGDQDKVKAYTEIIDNNLKVTTTYNDIRKEYYYPIKNE